MKKAHVRLKCTIFLLNIVIMNNKRKSLLKLYEKEEIKIVQKTVNGLCGRTSN
jgi:hypothetical protein